jgi:hypothetical protein
VLRLVEDPGRSSVHDKEATVSEDQVREAVDDGSGEPDVEGHWIDDGSGERGAVDDGSGERSAVDDGSGERGAVDDGSG